MENPRSGLVSSISCTSSRQRARAYEERCETCFGDYTLTDRVKQADAYGFEPVFLIRPTERNDGLSPELQGVLIGGGIGLATAALGHAFGWVQLKSSRAFDLRQAVYLEAAVAMANSLRFFDRVLDLSVEDGSLADDIHPISVAMFKIHVVGTPATIAALSSANHGLTVAALELTKRRTTLRSAVAQASHTDDVEAHREVDRLQREMAAASMRASLMYQRALVEMNVSVRRELGLPLAEAQYRASNSEAEQKIAATIEQANEPGESPTSGR